MINLEQPSPKTLIINGHTIEFEQRVAELFSLLDRVVVLLETDDFEFGDKLVGRNLIAYDSRGTQLWRVSDHGATLGARREDTVTEPDKTGRRRVPQSIVGAYFDEDDGVIRALIIDSELTIDPEDGKVLGFKMRR